MPPIVREYVHTGLVSAGIGLLTGVTAKAFQKLNVPHPAEAPKPHYEPKPRYQPRHDYQQPKKDWLQYHQNRQSNNHRGDWHGRG